jgi:hypothetical protein
MGLWYFDFKIDLKRQEMCQRYQRFDDSYFKNIFNKLSSLSLFNIEWQSSVLLTKMSQVRYCSVIRSQDGKGRIRAPGSKMIFPMGLGVGSMKIVSSDCGDFPPNVVIQKREEDFSTLNWKPCLMTPYYTYYKRSQYFCLKKR